MPQFIYYHVSTGNSSKAQIVVPLFSIAYDEKVETVHLGTDFPMDDLRRLKVGGFWRN
jgi:hypothetical protein